MQIPITGCPETRAYHLLQSMLTDEQKKTWKEEGYLVEPLRGEDEHFVRITKGGRCSLTCPHGTVMYCVHCLWGRDEGIPTLDYVITFLTWVRFDPKQWMKTARWVR